jgi:hypothetical protein
MVTSCLRHVEILVKVLKRVGLHMPFFTGFCFCAIVQLWFLTDSMVCHFSYVGVPTV